MIIKYDEIVKTFYLNTNKTTYAFCINEMSSLEHLYYGERISNMDLSHLRFRQTYNFSPYDEKIGESLSPDVFFQEISIENTGDFRICSLGIQNDKTVYGTRLRYSSHQIRKGRKYIKGLPCSNDDNAESLEIVLLSETGDLEVRLHYVVYQNEDVIVRYEEIVNCSEQPIHLLKACVCLDIQGHNFDMIDLFGTYHYERAFVQRVPLHYGVQGNFSHKGASSHETNPFMALCSPNATEDSGEVYGFNLVYSGNFKNEVQVDKLGNTRVVSGISDYGFDWILEAQEVFTTPEAVYTYSNQGIGQMSRNFHDYVRNHLINPRFVYRHRPVVVNTWEAFDFNINETNILDLVDSAKSIGAEMVVVDDGWFRDHDAEGLGDWKVKEKKFPSGLKDISNKLHQRGLQFGLWFEPEMINEDSELYRRHPEWVLRSGDDGLLWRNQYVLDMTNPNVVEHLFTRFCEVLDDVQIEYIKWDMNRYISEANSTYTMNQGEVSHRYIMGVYELLRRVTERYPEVLLETCAGGGGRFDLGMLYYSPQIWTSDNTDPFLRTDIQLGTSLAYPNSTISCHFTVSKASGFNADDDFRHASAAFGAYGYELDPRTLSEEQRKKLYRLAEKCRAKEHLMLKGDLYRLMDHHEGTFTSYMQVSRDKTEAIVTFIQYRYSAMNQGVVVRLKGLDPNRVYHCSLDEKAYRGDVLMHAGFRITGIKYYSGMGVYIFFDQIDD